MHDLCGAGWTPSEVFFPHAKPSDVSPYQHLFRAPLRFDSEFCALRFPVQWLDRRIQDADPAQLRIAEKEAESTGQGELLQRVCRALRVLLLHGKSAGNDVASAPEGAGPDLPAGSRSGPLRGRARAACGHSGPHRRRRGGAWVRQRKSLHALFPAVEWHDSWPMAAHGPRERGGREPSVIAGYTCA